MKSCLTISDYHTPRNTRILMECLRYGICLFGNYHLLDPQTILTPHDHGCCYEICYLDNGVQSYSAYRSSFSDKTDYQLSGGDVFITQPYELHSSGQSGQQRGSLYWIQIDSSCSRLFGQSKSRSDILQAELAGIGTHHFHLTPETAALLKEAFAQLRSSRTEMDVSFFRACELLTLFVLDLTACEKELRREVYPAEKLLSVKNAAVEFIQDNLTNPELSVEKVAEHLHYSKPYAMRVFRREVGMPMYEYIQRSRIELSCRMLEQVSIKDTAMLLNFSSSQHFSKVFREFTGQTPAAYRKGIVREKKDE